MSTHDKHLGRRVGERFVIEAPLGTGGMGSIYRGRDEQLGKNVAIKFLKRTLLEDSILRERFRREALSLAKLRHPGIVTVLDFGEADGELYTVLELLHGSTLAVLLDELRSHGNKPLGMQVARAAPIFDQLLAAIEVCHDNDIVHRDLKPANVMVETASNVDRVTLIDFGLARIANMGDPQASDVSRLTDTGVVHGTPHYMAPEQCRGEDVGSAADIYSVGVLFYEVLAGAEPFVGKDAATFMAQHLFVDPPPLRSFAPHVSSGIATAIHSALAKRPHERPSAQDLRLALASAFKGTDSQTLAETASFERRRGSGLSRSERAIPLRPKSAVDDAASTSGNVIVWMQNDEQSAMLRGCLGAAGLACSLSCGEDLPKICEDDGHGAVLVVSADRIGRIQDLRNVMPGVPIIVVGVTGLDQITASIRAGASDMMLREAPDSDLAAKVKRLLRRSTVGAMPHRKRGPP